MSRWSSRRPFTAALLSASLSLGGAAALCRPAQAASRGIIIEAVNAYVNGPLSNRIANADGFVNTVTQFGGFFQQRRLPDSQVHDTDFMDPEVTGNPQFHDDQNFDQLGAAFSFFSGHGQCNAGFINQLCQQNGDCGTAANPTPQGYRGDSGASCVFVDSQVTGHCHYQAPRYLGTSSPNNFQGAGDSYVIYNNFRDLNDFFYPAGFTPVAWGESEQSGNWRGAGVNGGTNVVVLDVSCGAYVGSLLADLGPAQAGVHMIATVMPTGGDTADVGDRGSTFANAGLMNSNSSVADSWVNLVTTMPADEGMPCVAGQGFRGINGCGGYVVLSMGATNDEPFNHLNESWVDVQDDNRDVTAFNFWTFKQRFNYDTVANPPLH